MLKRVADSLYWIGRYMERAESNARMLDVNLQVSLDFESGPLIPRTNTWESILATLEDRPKFLKSHPRIDADSASHHVTFDPGNTNSIVSCVNAARENAAPCATISPAKCGSR